MKRKKKEKEKDREIERERERNSINEACTFAYSPAYNSRWSFLCEQQSEQRLAFMSFMPYLFPSLLPRTHKCAHFFVSFSPFLFAKIQPSTCVINEAREGTRACAIRRMQTRASRAASASIKPKSNFSRYLTDWTEIDRWLRVIYLSDGRFWTIPIRRHWIILRTRLQAEIIRYTVEDR